MYHIKRLLSEIVHYPANGNSDPDVMADALDAINAMAVEALGMDEFGAKFAACPYSSLEIEECLVGGTSSVNAHTAVVKHYGLHHNLAVIEIAQAVLKEGR